MKVKFEFQYSERDDQFQLFILLRDKNVNTVIHIIPPYVELVCASFSVCVCIGDSAISSLQPSARVDKFRRFLFSFVRNFFG